MYRIDYSVPFRTNVCHMLSPYMWPTTGSKVLGIRGTNRIRPARGGTRWATRGAGGIEGCGCTDGRCWCGRRMDHRELGKREEICHLVFLCSFFLLSLPCCSINVACTQVHRLRRRSWRLKQNDESAVFLIAATPLNIFYAYTDYRIHWPI